MIHTAVEMCIDNDGSVWDSIDNSEYSDRRTIEQNMRRIVEILQKNLACVIANQDDADNK